MWRVTLKGLLAHKLRLALTALAIVLGVTFIAGTFVLTDTLHQTFNTLFGNIYQNIDFQVRGVAQFGSGGNATRNAVPESLVSRVRSVTGVEAAGGSVTGYAQYISHDGKAITTGGAPTLGVSFDPNQQISVLHLTQGTGPTTSRDVVMDLGTAQKYDFKVGQRVRILLEGPTRTFTITGLARFGTADNLAGATLAAFNVPTAQSLLGDVGKFDDINVVAQPGANKAEVQHAIARVLPRGVEVVSAQTVINEQTSQVSQALGFFNTALLVFGFIALFVGAFTILNTFSIIVGQRTRELALLRIVGASRRQVFRSVLGEAAVVGLVSSLIGLGLGVLAALGLEALLSGFGVTLPSGPIVFEPRTVVVCLVVGVGVTVVSAISPARTRRADSAGGCRLRPTGRGRHLATAPIHVGVRDHPGGCRRPGLRPHQTSRRAGGSRRRIDLHRSGPPRPCGGASDLQFHRASPGAHPGHVGSSRTGELHAQPAPYGPDCLGPDGRSGTRVGYRGVRRIAVEVGHQQRRRCHQCGHHRHHAQQRAGRILQRGRAGRRSRPGSDQPRRPCTRVNSSCRDNSRVSPQRRQGRRHGR